MLLLCDGNFDDLIFIEVSKLNSKGWIIIGSVHTQFLVNVLSKKSLKKVSIFVINAKKSTYSYSVNVT